MENKEPDSRLSVRKQDFEDPELYRLNQVINDLYSKVSTARDETDEAARRFTRSGVISSVSDSSAPSVPPVVPGDGLPQVTASDWSFNPIVYSAGEDGQQYGFVSITVTNKPPKIDYFSLFIQDYSSGYVNTAGTAVTLTSDSKSAGTTFENCVAGQVININSVAYTIASTPVSPYETLTLTSSAGTQSNVYFNLNPVDGAWQEIAPNAETGEWVLRPPTGLDVPACVTASTAEEKTYEPADGINYKRLVLAPWGDAPQLSAFTVNIEQQTQAGVPSGRFVVNFTKPLDPEYYYSSIERLWYVNNTFTGDIGATAIVDVSGTTVTYNTTSPIYGPTFKGQYFNYLQPGDTVYISAGPTLSETNTYIISEVISNTQLKLTTAPPAGTGQVFAQWIRIAAEANSFRQNDYWPLPTNPEYWKFRARSVNHRERANNTGFPTVNVTVPNSSGITQVAPGVITAAAFASTIRPVDLITTAGISLTSVVVAAGGVATVTTSSAHGLATGRQVAIYGGLGNASKLNGLFSITNTGANTFTITTSGVLAGTYTVGLFEAPLPALPSAIYPNGAVAFLTANTRLYRSSGSAWTAATDGGDIVANSITAGQIAAGAISTTELFAGEILVGKGGGKPTLFKVVDSGGTMIGFIGDISTPTYPVSFTGGYFQNLLIAPTLSLASTPRIYATSAGTMELVGVTIQSTNVGTAGFDPGTVIISPGNPYGPVQVSSASISSLSAVGPNYFTARSNNPGNFYPYCELYRTSSRAIVRGFADPFFASFFEFSADATPASSYANFKSVPIQINSTTVIDSSRNGSFVNLTLTGSLTAGGGTGSSGQVLTSTGTGVQWTTAAAGTLTSINGMAGPAITIAAGSGISVSSATNTVTVTNSGVTSITGTANQVIASASTGSITLSLPQSIATTSNVAFNQITLTSNLLVTAPSVADIGSSANYFQTLYVENIEAAPAGVANNYVKVRKLDVADISGGSGFWNHQAVASISASSYTIRDNAGSRWISGSRQIVGLPDNTTNLFTNLIPSLRSTASGDAVNDITLPSLGLTTARWSSIWGDAITITNTVSASTVSGTTMNATQYNVYTDNVGDIGQPALRFGNVYTYGITLSGAVTAGGSTGSSGQLLASTGSGVQWQNIASRLSAGTGISISGTTTATISNAGVTSITGTSNQVIASASTGGVTLSLPQSIATTSSVTFNSMTLANGSSNGILIKDTGGTARVCLTIASDNNLYLDNNDSSYDIYIRPGSGRYTFVDGSYFAPFTNNVISLGYNGQGWSNVYSYNYWTNDGGTWYQGIDGTFDVTTSNTLTIRNGIITAIT